jgi:hypothetical protein
MGGNSAQKNQMNLQNQLLGMQVANAGTGNEITKLQAEDYNKFRPQINELQSLSLADSLANEKSPVWAKKRGMGETLMSGIGGMQALGMDNPDVQKLKNVYDASTANWAKDQLGMQREDSASAGDFGSSYRGNQIASLGKLIADQKAANLRQAMSDIANQYSQNVGYFDWATGGNTPMATPTAPNVNVGIPQFPSQTKSGTSSALGKTLMSTAGGYY